MAFGSTYALHTVNTVLGVASIVAFDRVCRRLVPGPELGVERHLMVACYGLGPTCLAGAVNFTPDYGVLAFFVLMLERLLAARFGLAAIWGACMLLSKEPGVLLYAASVATFALHAWIRPRTYPARGALLRAALCLLAPCVLLAGVKLAELAVGAPVLWGGERTSDVLLPMVLDFNLLNPTFLTYAFDVFALGFNWILGLPVALLFCTLAWRAIAKREAPAPDGIDTRTGYMVLTLFALAFVLLTRFRTVNNVRYLAALTPLFILTAGYALSALDMGRLVRRLLLGLSLVFTFSFNFHSLDPVSRAFFGTFAFGDHELLRAASRDVCCGYGRDQLAYNLELTQLHYVQNAIYRELKPGPDTVLSATKLADVQLSGRIDRHTFERTLRTDDTHTLHLIGVRELLERNPAPARVYFLAFPNFDNSRAYALLAQRYDELEHRVYRNGGYALLVHTLALTRPAPRAP